MIALYKAVAKELQLNIDPKNNQVANFVEKYLAMLSAGGTKRHNELLGEFGLSMHHESFWQQGLNRLVSYIDMLEELLK